MTNRKPLATVILCLSLVFAQSGCESTYFNVMEKAGFHKRDILIDRVEDTRDAQKESQQTFESALAQLTTLIAFDGGKLQQAYEALEDQYDASLASAEKVTDRIVKVESVANALFDEWRTELEQYQNQNLRRQSEKTLLSTERKFKQLLHSMHQAEKKMQPVLRALNDNTLYLKHNLNAQAIGAIKNEYTKIKADVGALVADMNKAIAESDAFIESMEQQQR